jgi:hypothetical protein
VTSSQTFRGVLQLNGKTATGIEVPEAVVSALGPGKKPAVTVTFSNGFSYRTTVAPMGGQYWIPVSAERREGAGLTAGDEVEVTLELDNAPREVEVPEDFKRALAGDAAAKDFFDRLAYSHKLRHVLSITDAKTPETRERRIEKAMELLRQGRK